MKFHCTCVLNIIVAVSAANLAYLPRPTSPQHAAPVQKEFYVYSAPVEQLRRQSNALVAPNRQQSHAYRKPMSTPFAAYAVKYKYRTPEEVIQAIVQQYGVKPKFATTSTSRMQQLSTKPTATVVPASSRSNHLVSAANEPSAAPAHSEGHAILPPNTPVHKNYAQNFLPGGTDVVPGSSYIPLLLKH